MNNYKLRYLFASLLLALGLLIAGCSDDKQANTAQTDRLVSDQLVPGSTFYTSTTKDLTIQGKGFAQGDALTLVGIGTGEELHLSVKAIDYAYVTFDVPQDITSGSYRLVIHRGKASQVLGVLKFRRSLDIEIPDKEGMNVKGVVFCGSLPVPGVVVSDGEIVTTTDDTGCYYLASKKHHGYVFVSVPSGYEPQAENSIPQIWGPVTPGEEATEQVDFELIEAPGQDNFDLLVLADMHLANRVGDMAQYRNLMLPDVKDYIAKSSKKVYLLNVGDMTFDLYWNSNKYNMGDYVNTLKDSSIPALIYHLPGNHDNDEYARDDYTAEQPYKDYLGPTYYSFNIGKIHFIMLDNTIYLNAGADPSLKKAGDHSYNPAFTEMELEWLKADLATVKDKNAPLVIGTHCQVFYYNSSLEINASMAYGHSTILDEMLREFTDVHIISGHTHNNTTMKIRNGLMEHNTGGSCATWWWTGYYSNGHICKDGAPGGMGVYEFAGTDMEWYYKGFDEPRNLQFRTYDMNNVKTFFANNSIIRNLIRYYPNRNDYAGVGNNVVYINVWNWDPEWTVSVKENGVELGATRVYMKDPLHTYAYDATRVYKNSNNTYTDSFISSNNYHIFAANASSATSTLTIEVTDRFGNKYTETMSRPKEFAAQIENL
ncbi:calcineurin-like phosphoesterase family protein [uncultured Alistipes sp.]|jgi:calcineurin-like phosphoesterase|uniref:calcineurin-like phosphoesterase family protein n=1 Tax=uncultured Alistipes sp. TaxID=538949 RepID=UPI0025D9B6C2|nr:calcineurin-like phosphoesterase family protein [uncultured Alistipes sp.]